MVAATEILDNNRYYRFDLTTDSSTDGIVLERSDKVIVVVTGTFDSGTVTMQYSVDGTTWVSDPDISFTAAGVAIFYCHPFLYFRATLAGSSSPELVVSFLA